jgi:glyoxylase-like metal-dependent hydrolase (beta-lactamase superfamily II)
MRRLAQRAVVVASVVLVAAASLSAQAPSGGSAKDIDVQKLQDNLYVLKGGGGNTAIFITSDGVTVVDAKNPGWGQAILDTIKTLTNKPVTRLINTHAHNDHVGGNVEFPVSVEVVAHENAKAGMERMAIFKQNNLRGLPTRTFKDKMTIGKGADQIDLYYFGVGHTDSDAFVVFPALRTAHVGDIFARRALPPVDAENGGSVLHYPDTLSKAYNGIKNVDTIINSHEPVMTTTWADLKTFTEFTQDFLTWAQAEVTAGRSPEQAATEWKMPARYEPMGYDGRVGPLFGGIAGRVQRLADELKK